MRATVLWLALAAASAAAAMAGSVTSGCASEGESAPAPGAGAALPGGAGGSGGALVGGGGGEGAQGGQAGSGGSPCVPADEVCDGQDNNCDGDVDEGCTCANGDAQDCYSGDVALVGHGVCAYGTQICDLEGVWGDCDSEVLPTDESCNGLDDDCNDAVDDGIEDVVCGLGACQTTVPGCQDGEPVPCIPPPPDPPEDCDGSDDDCDGTIDEDCDCLVGAEQDCYTGAADTRHVGECHDGTQVCEVDQWGPCLDDQTPESELCDGLDNDCDDVVDDGDPESGGVCTTGLSGICSPGILHCVDAALVCQQNEQPAPELCDGVDNDCNSESPDGADEPTFGSPCDGADPDLCPEGMQICTSGSLICTDQTDNTLDVCDGVDNDCDVGSADGAEDPQSSTPCDGDDSDLCIGGMWLCVGGALACSDPPDSALDLCDGVNNDCDPASADGSEDPLLGTACDGTDGDLCPEGTRSCVMGSLVCSDSTGNALDVCDGADNDCDPSSPDGSEDSQVNTTCDGPDTDLCKEGTRSCENAALVCSDDSNDTLDVCDGQNNDCNPATPDGSADPQVGALCDGADGDLCKEGTFSCPAGSLVCSDSTANTLDVCDNADNDCDPASADGSEDPQLNTPCDGPDSDLCLEGSRLCVSGSLSCTDTTSGALDVCDNVDNDCDPASVDGSEDPQLGTSCDGPDSDLCNEGTRACSNGSLACSDTTASTFDICDGQDNDCDPLSLDGSEDPQLGTACDGPDGDLCAEGIRSCSGGSLVCSDSTGNALDVCNGADDDCDPASADGAEDPQLGAACDGSDADLCQDGQLICTAGSLVCNDGPSTGLEVCDGFDNDCNAATPDGSQDPLIGAACDGADSDLCTEGTYSCSAGALVCSDTTGSTIDVCNGANDDCDPASIDGSEDPLVAVPCDGTDSDLCKEGTSSCTAGAVVCSDTTSSTTDICDGQDNDCDPASADGAEDPQNGVACDGPDGDLCNEGTKSCSAGAIVCSDNTSNTLDVCNGSNDDCDAASADGSEDPLNGTSCDGADSDLCAEGTRSCSAGALVCSDTTGSTVDLCNGADDDCDAASADGSEDPQNGVACDGADSDLCTEGARYCSGGSLLCNDPVGDNDLDVCNGVNDDCDAASADGSEDPLNGTSCDGADSDLCAEGTRSCSAGALVCSDTTSSTVDLCNGLNDDCDAASADGSEDPLVGIACDGTDTDLCAEGTSFCGGGTVACNDTTGNTIEICGNSNDEDCNGVLNNGCTTCGSTTCPGTSCVEVGGSCVYLADPTSKTKAEAAAICSSLGTGWNICSSTQICQSAVYTYLAGEGCSCSGGPSACNCTSINVYVHALDFTNSLWTRALPSPACTTDTNCAQSGSYTCGAVLCCH